MPVISGLTDPVMVKLFHKGWTDREIAEEYGITPSAVGQRRRKLGLHPNPVSLQVNKDLSVRWDIWSAKEGTAHHNLHSAKALKIWLRIQLGDTTLSEAQTHLAQMWVRGLMERGEVLCYDPGTEDGWWYRRRTPADRNLLIDWPEDLPFPSEKFRKALELPPRPPGDPGRGAFE